jgi:hypothetical protein
MNSWFGRVPMDSSVQACIARQVFAIYNANRAESTLLAADSLAAL